MVSKFYFYFTMGGDKLISNKKVCDNFQVKLLDQISNINFYFFKNDLIRYLAKSVKGQGEHEYLGKKFKEKLLIF